VKLNTLLTELAKDWCVMRSGVLGDLGSYVVNPDVLVWGHAVTWECWPYGRGCRSRQLP